MASHAHSLTPVQQRPQRTIPHKNDSNVENFSRGFRCRIGIECFYSSVHQRSDTKHADPHDTDFGDRHKPTFTKVRFRASVKPQPQNFPLARIPSPSIHHYRGLQRNFGILRKPGSNRMNIADDDVNPNVQHASFSPTWKPRLVSIRFVCALGGLLCALLILYANTIVTALSQMKQRMCHTCRTYILYYSDHGARYTICII